MHIESTANVIHRERFTARLETMSDAEILAAYAQRVESLSELPAWAFNGNVADRLGREKHLCKLEATKRRLAV